MKKNAKSRIFVEFIKNSLILLPIHDIMVIPPFFVISSAEKAFYIDYTKNFQ